MSTDVFRRYIDIVTESAAHAVTEMDKSQPSHGRDGHVSHSTYGSRDKEGSDYFKGKQLPAKPITVNKMEKDALDILKKQGVEEDIRDDAMAGLQKTIDFAQQHGYKIYRSPTGRKMRFVNKELEHEIRAQVDNYGDSINVNFMDYYTGTSGNDDASYFDQVFKDAYEQALWDYQNRRPDDENDDGPYTLSQLKMLQKQGVAEAAKWRADDLEGKTWRSPDWDDGDLSPSKIRIDRSGKDIDDSGDELTSRPSAWRGKADMAKRMTKKGVPTKSELAFQDNLKMRMRMKKKEGGLTGPKGVLPEQGVAEGTKTLADYIAESERAYSKPVTGDYFAINIREETLFETWVCNETADGIVIYADDAGLALLERYGYLGEAISEGHDFEIDSDEDSVDVVDQGEYDQEGDMAKDDLATIVRAARRLTGMLDDNDNLPEWVQAKITKAADYVDTAADYIESNREQGVAEGDMAEAKYQGREVPLGKPMKGDVKKSKVYVRGPKGNVVKVNFGQKGMKIKKNIPGRRKNFRARHNCANPGPRWKARYWSCRAW